MSLGIQNHSIMHLYIYIYIYIIWAALKELEEWFGMVFAAQ